MAQVCLEAQQATQGSLMFQAIRSVQNNVLTEESIASSSVNSAFELSTRCIIVLTNSGRTARLIAKYRPPCPVFCVTKNASTARQLSITRGCFSFVWDQHKAGDDQDREKRVEKCVVELKKSKFLAAGHRVILVHADAATVGFANQTRVMVIR